RRVLFRSDAKSHEADANLVRPRLRPELPLTLALQLEELAHAALMEQHVEHEIADHPVREVRVDVAHDGHIRELGVLHQVIHTGANGDDEFKIGEGLEHANRRAPGKRVADVLDAPRLGPYPDVETRV